MKNKIRSYLTITLVGMLTFSSLSGCGKNEDDIAAVSDEVAKNLLENEDSSGEETTEEKTSDDADKKKADTSTDKSASDTDGTDSADSTDSKDEDTVKTGKIEDDRAYVENPFVGYDSTATSYDIKFSIDTDSGLAGFAWGFTDDADVNMSSTGNRITHKEAETVGSDYYVWAIELVRDFPRLYTSRRQIDPSTGEELVYDEVYTNLDMMYPEMSMYTGVTHYIEIKVNGTTATTYLDSVEVCTTALHDARPIGQIGTWVMEGNYHEYIDDLFIAEGVNGDGDYLYSEDFSGKTNIFNPYLKNKDGKLYAKAGLYFVPRTE